MHSKICMHIGFVLCKVQITFFQQLRNRLNISHNKSCVYIPISANQTSYAKYRRTAHNTYHIANNKLFKFRTLTLTIWTKSVSIHFLGSDTPNNSKVIHSFVIYWMVWSLTVNWLWNSVFQTDGYNDCQKVM